MASEAEAVVKAVEIRAELRQIKTMADHTANITLNVPEYCREQVKVMLDWLGQQIGAVIVAVPIENTEQDKGANGTVSRRAAKKRIK